MLPLLILNCLLQRPAKRTLFTAYGTAGKLALALRHVELAQEKTLERRKFMKKMAESAADLPRKLNHALRENAQVYQSKP